MPSQCFIAAGERAPALRKKPSVDKSKKGQIAPGGEKAPEPRGSLFCSPQGLSVRAVVYKHSVPAIFLSLA